MTHIRHVILTSQEHHGVPLPERPRRPCCSDRGTRSLNFTESPPCCSSSTPTLTSLRIICALVTCPGRSRAPSTPRSTSQPNVRCLLYRHTQVPLPATARCALYRVSCGFPPLCSACHMQHCSARCCRSWRSVVCNRHENGEARLLPAEAAAAPCSQRVFYLVHGRLLGYWSPARRWG